MKKSSESHDRRQARVERELKELIAQFLIKGLKVRLPGLVTITRVGVSGDYKTAKVFFSFLGSEKEKDEAWDLLDERTHEVQRYVGGQLQMKFCPRISFHFDEGLEKALKVQGLIDEISRERKSQGPNENRGPDGSPSGDDSDNEDPAVDEEQ